MARHNGSGGVHHTTKQTGRSRRGAGAGSYSRRHKARHADHYDHPFTDGAYLKWAKDRGERWSEVGEEAAEAA
jgi:hypothetical protein